MRVRLKVRFIVASAALLALAHPACSDNDAFQPITNGAQPWNPPPNWAPELQCATGYYVAIHTCPGCTGISYALCTGLAFDQCVCGGPPTPGATCPNQLHCSANDFPPQNWLEFTDYTGPGWAGLDMDADAGGG